MSHLKTAIAAFALCSATPLLANLPVSRTTSLQSLNVTASSRIFLALPGHSEPLFRGQVTTVAGNTVSLAGTVPAISPGSAVAQVVTGTNRGRYFSISSATSGSVTLLGFTGSGVSLDGSDQLELIPLWTLGTLPVTGISEGEEGDPSTGDVVTVIASSGIATTYYATDIGFLTEVGDVPSDGVVIPFGAAVLYQPVATKTVVVSGVIPPTKVKRESASGTLAGVSPKFGQALTLADLEPLVVQGELGDPSTGDLVLIVDAGLVKEVYYADDGDWHLTSDDSVISDATAIPVGHGFGITSIDSLPLSLD